MITAKKVLALLGLEDQALIPKIEALIPPWQNWLSDYLNNYFHTNNWLISSEIAFVAGDTTITDTQNGFVTSGFLDDSDVHVEGSKRNNEIFKVSTVDDGVLTLTNDEEVFEEAAENTIRMTMIHWPKGLEFVSAKAIEHDLGRTKPVVQLKRAVSEVGEYPDPILKRLKPYKRMKVDKWDGNLRVRKRLI